MAKLYYQGHGSYRITTAQGTVIYVDPAMGDGYDVPADIVIVTHEHADHNQVQLVPKKATCVVWRAADMLKDGVYQTLNHLDVTVHAVQACNKNHPIDKCVGCIITLDGKKIYAAGDTSRTEDMEKRLPQEKLDYALLPIDGVYNMGPEEASECARLIGAKHTIPVHSSPTGVAKPHLLWDEAQARRMDAPGLMLVRNGESVTL